MLDHFVFVNGDKEIGVRDGAEHSDHDLPLDNVEHRCKINNT